MIQWYHHKGDAKIPTMIVEKRQRYLDICGCGDPPVPEVVATNENDVAAADAGDHEITATAAAGVEIAVTDAGDNYIAASNEDSSDALVIWHEV
jgi:hypothetical protein